MLSEYSTFFIWCATLPVARLGFFRGYTSGAKGFDAALQGAPGQQPPDAGEGFKKFYRKNQLKFTNLFWEKNLRFANFQKKADKQLI